MECKYSGWAQFWKEATDFSPSFREQMSEQLFLRFYEILGIKDKTRMRFMLRVGLEEMQIVVREEYAFGLVTVISPTAYAKTITAYWKKENNVLNAINDTSLNRSKIEFGWCSDFDKAFFLEFVKPKKQLSKKKNNLNFNVEYDYTLYPDLTLTIHTKNELDENTLKKIHTILNQHISNTYISEITNEGDEYCGIFDFHDNPYEKGVAELLVAFQELSKLSLSSSIKKIIVE